MVQQGLALGAHFNLEPALYPGQRARGPVPFILLKGSVKGIAYNSTTEPIFYGSPVSAPALTTNQDVHLTHPVAGSQIIGIAAAPESIGNFNTLFSNQSDQIPESEMLRYSYPPGAPVIVMVKGCIWVLAGSPNKAGMAFHAFKDMASVPKGFWDVALPPPDASALTNARIEPIGNPIKRTFEYKGKTLYLRQLTVGYYNAPDIA